jgi:hypothetical protein
MTREIEFNLNTEEMQKSKIKLLKSINSCGVKLCETNNTIKDFDYYSIIEINEDRFIVVCWNDGDKKEHAKCYIAEYE